MKLESYSKVPAKDAWYKTTRDSIWGTFEPNIMSPLIYLQRPMWITCDDTWNKILDSVTLSLPEGFNIPTEEEVNV